MLNRRLLRTKVLRSLYSHIKSERSGAEATLSQYQRGVSECYDLHLFLLDLLVEVQEYAKGRLKIASEKLRPTAEDLNPNLRFVENSVIEALAQNSSLSENLKQANLDWKEQDQVIRDMHNQIIASDFYRSYMDGVSNDRDFVLKVLNTLIEDNEVLEQALEDISIHWIDDLGYANLQAIRYIEQDKSDKLLPQFKSADDRIFGEQLLLHSIAHHSEYAELVESLIDNWDIERTAFMDRVIMITAVSEAINCPTIPIKVTLDEYIEISKFYSTPSSANFINGVLNKAFEQLKAEGKIKKSGRGLME